MFESTFVPKAAERPEPTYRLMWVVFGLCVLMLLYQALKSAPHVFR
jgi:hypothetical protein